MKCFKAIFFLWKSSNLPFIYELDLPSLSLGLISLAPGARLEWRRVKVGGRKISQSKKGFEGAMNRQILLERQRNARLNRI